MEELDEAARKKEKAFIMGWKRGCLERRLRHRCKALNMKLHKSRRPFSATQWGMYQLIAGSGVILLGTAFDATLEEIERYLAPLAAPKSSAQTSSGTGQLSGS